MCGWQTPRTQTLSRRQLQALRLIPSCTRLGFVTNKSSLQTSQFTRITCIALNTWNIHLVSRKESFAKSVMYQRLKYPDKCWTFNTVHLRDVIALTSLIWNLQQQQIIPNELNIYCCVHFSPGVPVILIKGVFNGHYRILLSELLVDTEQLIWRQLNEERKTITITEANSATVLKGNIF